MAYGKLKADTLVYDNSGSDVEVTISSLGNKANLNSPTFTGTPVVPGYAPLAGATFTGNVVMSANLTVQGTTTTISSTTIEVADKNLELGKVSTPTDTTADGGGITLKGASDKTFNWVDATDAWTSSEHIHLGDSKELKIGTGEDLKISHGGSDSRIINTTGDLKIRSQSLKLETTDAQEYIRCTADQDVKLFYDNVQKFNTSAAGVTVTGTVSDSKGDLRSIPQNNQTSNYQLQASDAGKHITGTGDITWTNNTFSAGDAVTIINNSGSAFAINKGTNMYWLDSSSAVSDANRTLAPRGMATLLFTTGTACYISGAGLS